MKGIAMSEKENPFEAIIRKRRNVPAPSGNFKMDRLQQRLHMAQLTAAKQRDMGFKQLNAANPTLEERVEAAIKQAQSESTPHTSIPSGHQAWIGMWMCIWFLLTLVMTMGNFLGGLLLSIPLFFICTFIGSAPRLLASAFSDGQGRNNNGAAV